LVVYQHRARNIGAVEVESTRDARVIRGMASIDAQFAGTWVDISVELRRSERRRG